jgi:hypothetical protein
MVLVEEQAQIANDQRIAAAARFDSAVGCSFSPIPKRSRDRESPRVQPAPFVALRCLFQQEITLC